MKNRTAALLTLILAISVPIFGATKPQPLPPMTAEKWRADIDHLARELPRRHMNAFHAVTKEEFAAAVTSLRARAGQASDDEIIVGLMQITAMVGDGHTRIRLPSNVHQFPLSVVRIEGEHRIVRGAGAAGELVGGKLIRIDATELNEALARIRTILPQHESEVLFTAFTPQWFSIAEVLHGLGITRSASTARFTVMLDDGSERTAEVAAIDLTSTPQWRVAASPPLYRQRLDENFWFTWLADAGTVYVNFRRYDNLRSKSRELWSFVDQHPVRKVVIDLRQNGGGDFHVGRKYLVDELTKRTNVRGYVITGARTFSAALKNAIDFREVARATLVGETIGERPNSYSENDEFTLPHSRLEVSYSTKYYKFLPGDGLVKPDKEIHPTWADWVAGRDPVLDWILGQ